MPTAPQPVLVYNRIAANVRKTRLLMATFAGVLLPVMSAATVFVMPWVTMLTAIGTSAWFGSEQVAQRIDALTGELDAARPQDGLVRLGDLPASFLWLTGGLLLVAFAIAAIGFAAVTVFLVSRYGSRMLLRAAQARPVVGGEEPELVRLVENLCIGAGLPMPALYIVESPSPNAFATGRDPDHASLVITRGLLTLVDRRELQGVIAHELSHIGNHDTRLTALVASLVGATSLPLRMCVAPIRVAFRIHRGFGVFASIVAGYLGLVLLVGFWFSIQALSSDEVWRELPAFMWWWTAHAMFTPVYVLLVAPVAALVIRQAVSREREFLADADAVRLTRDHEGLALALVKIGTAHGEPLRVGEGSVHLYIVDPRGSRSLLHRIFPSHPPLDSRLELLANMGSGIPMAAIDAAIEAGKRAQRTASVKLAPVWAADPVVRDVRRTNNETSPEREWPLAPVDENASQPRRTLVPLYEQPDGWSRVLARLEEHAPVTPVGTEGGFVCVITPDNIRGYVSASARLTALREVGDLPDARPRS